MNKKQKLVLACGISLVLLLVTSTIPVAADVGKSQPEVGKVVFVHYPQGNGSASKPGNGNSLLYSYSGYHWANPDISYKVDPSITGDFLIGIDTAFATWDGASGSYAAHNAGSATSVPGTRDATWNGTQWIDVQNVIGFKNLGTSAIGVTYMWYNKKTKEIIEIDTALNSNPYFNWCQNSNDETWDMANITPAYDVDVQNIMTHEAGHWLILNDLYSKIAIEQTMYGRSSQYDLAKRTLESGDIAGIQAIYGGT